MERATVQATEDFPVRLTRDFRMGLSTTKPLSQKTGMDTIQPMISMASSGFFLPTSLTTQSDILRAAPVTSSRIPTRAPRMITMPMLVKVPEKPAPITPGMSAKAMSDTRASRRETPIMERNGWIFSLEIARIISTTATTNAMINGTPVIWIPPQIYLQNNLQIALNTLCIVQTYYILLLIRCIYPKEQ